MNREAAKLGLQAMGGLRRGGVQRRRQGEGESILTSGWTKYNGWMGMDGRTEDGRTDGRMDGWMDGWMDGVYTMWMDKIHFAPVGMEEA